MSKKIQFIDQSKPGPGGPITGWDWDFGDGGTSTEQNPIHEYLSSGIYSVKLTITGSGIDGSDDVTHNLDVDVPVPIADFSFVVDGLSVDFSDLSEPGPSGPITDWDWAFGDGQTSSGGSGGEFPTTGLLDNFDSYAAGTLNAKGNWLAPLGGGGSAVQVGGNVAHTINPLTTACTAYLTPNYGPDCEAYATIVQHDTQNPTSNMRIMVRVQNPTSATIRSQYQVNVQGNGTWKIEKCINNNTTALATFTQAVANGDKFGISVVGQLITAWWWDATDSTWHVVGTYTDEAADKITAAGKIGLWLGGTAGDSTMTIDDVSGGTVVAGADSSPTHVYEADGSYDVTLTVTGSGSDGTDDVTKSVVVRSGSALSAIFSSSISDALVSFNSQSQPGPSGPITAYDWDFGDGSTHGTTANPTHSYAASGTYTVRLTVTGTGTDGTDYVEHDVVVTVPPPATGTIFEQFIAASNFDRPEFVPTRTVRFKDLSGLTAAIADLRGGDLVKYDPDSFGLPKQPLTITSTFRITNKKLSSRAVIDFGCSHNVWDSSKIVPDYVAFRNTGIQIDPFFMADCANIDIWGGDFFARGNGFRVQGDITDCQLLDMYIHDIGQSGIVIQPVDSSTGASRTHDGLVVRCEVNRFAMDPSHDPHGDKGTGWHGATHHGNSGHLDNSHFYYYIHDSLRPGETSYGIVYPEGAGGSACEPGTDNTGSFASQNNNHYTVYGENLLMTPMHTGCVNPGSTISQTGGNILNNWGSVPMNGMICDFLGAKNISGAIMHGAGGGWSNANPRIRVLKGRGEDTNQFVGGGGNVADRYVQGKNIDYVDCT